MLYHTDITSFFEENFALMQHHGWSLNDLENMIPWERETYMLYLNNYLEKKKLEAEVAWSKWEGSTSVLSYAPEMVSSFSEPRFALAFALIENHYFINKGFLKNENQLITSESIDKIRHIPAKIVQGRYDIVCPMETAWELSKNWPEAELIIAPSSGHSAFEKEITHHLINTTNEYGKTK